MNSIIVSFLNMAKDWRYNVFYRSLEKYVNIIVSEDVYNCDILFFGPYIRKTSLDFTKQVLTSSKCIKIYYTCEVRKIDTAFLHASDYSLTYHKYNDPAHYGVTY